MHFCIDQERRFGASRSRMRSALTAACERPREERERRRGRPDGQADPRGAAAGGEGESSVISRGASTGQVQSRVIATAADFKSTFRNAPALHVQLRSSVNKLWPKNTCTRRRPRCLRTALHLNLLIIVSTRTRTLKVLFF